MQFSSTLRHCKFLERKGASQGVIQHSDPRERGPCAPKFEDRSEEETLTRMRPQKGVGNGKKYPQAQWKGQGFVGCLVSTSAILNESRGKRVYHSPGNQFERFREFLELISRFEFEQCGRTCACAVACLSPHNSISNVVVSVTIHDNVHIYQRCCKNMIPLWKVVQIVRCTWVSVAKDKSNHPAADSLRSVPQESWS